jgi:hypothetical protein
LNLPDYLFDEYIDDFLSRLDTSMKIITYCDGEGYQLGFNVAEKLYQLGFERVFYLTNGWGGWQENSCQLTGKGISAIMKSENTGRYDWLHLLLRILLGVIFIYAGCIKLFDPGAFAQAVYNYKILPLFMVNPVAVILPWIEVISQCSWLRAF